LAVPQKAEQLARFCDYFWLAAPKGIVPIAELPANWGLLELVGSKLCQAKEGNKLSPEAQSKDFLAGVFRAASRPVAQDEVAAAVAVETAKLRETLSASFEDRVKLEVERRTARNQRHAESWRSLAEAVGTSDWMLQEQLVSAVKLVLATGASGASNGVHALLQQLKSATTAIEAAAAAISPPSGVV
jgi:hypothetical protein